MQKCAECGIQISDAEAKNPLDGRKLCPACFARWRMAHQPVAPARPAVPDYPVFWWMGGGMRVVGVLAAGTGAAVLLAVVILYYLGVHIARGLAVSSVLGFLYGMSLAVAGELLLMLRDVVRHYQRR